MCMNIQWLAAFPVSSSSSSFCGPSLCSSKNNLFFLFCYALWPWENLSISFEPFTSFFDMYLPAETFRDGQNLFRLFFYDSVLSFFLDIDCSRDNYVTYTAHGLKCISDRIRFVIGSLYTTSNFCSFLWFFKWSNFHREKYEGISLLDAGAWG